MLPIIWFFFMAVFFYLGIAHYRNARTELRSFRIRKPTEQESASIADEAAIVIREFVVDFNRYLDILSQNLRTQNLITSVAYFLAGFAALASWVLGYIE